MKSKIVVGVDHSAASDAALGWALGEASFRNAELEVVHAWSHPYDGPRTNVSVPRDEEKLEAMRELKGTLERGFEGKPDHVPVHHRLVEGAPAEALIDAAKDADMLVVGSRGRGGFAGLLLGSVSEQVMHHAPCPVTIVRG